MFLLTLTRKLYKLLSSDASPSAIAFGVSFGVLAGCVPIKSGLALCLLLVVLIFRVQVSAALFAWGLTRLLSTVLLARAFETIGYGLVENDSLRGFWTWFLNLPVVAWWGLQVYATVGGAVVGAVLGAGLFLPVRIGVVSYRRWLHDRVSKNKFFKWLTNFWAIKLLRFVFVGVGA